MIQDVVADLENGLLHRRIFSDPEIHQLELERVFGRSWLFLAHESMLPNPGDYVTNYMGTEPVIVTRDESSGIHAFLNTCRHRGNRVCLFERGNTKQFTCSYHGWTYDLAGKLHSVPYLEGAYLGELDRQSWGLAQVPRIQDYGGLIFG